MSSLAPKNATAQGCENTVSKVNFQLILESSTTFSTKDFVFSILHKHTWYIKIFNI